MSATIDELRRQVTGLRVHTDRQGRPSLKKPLLLLLVLSRLESGELTANRIRFEDIADDLASLIKRFGGREVRGGAGADQPFVYLSTAPFWELNLPPGAPEKAADQRKRAILTDPLTFASLTPSVFELLSSSADARQKLASGILEQWWQPPELSKLKSELGL